MLDNIDAIDIDVNEDLTVTKTVKLTREDHRRINQKRQEQMFLKELREQGISHEDYIEYENARILSRFR
ncbi:hypothetical protein ACRTC3_11690 [Photobacterium damselae]|uniref:hypothetical protein n=1 Tax=Photobacterium damselae TaxID=38293 RepID=UPI003D7DEAAF